MNYRQNQQQKYGQYTQQYIPQQQSKLLSQLNQSQEDKNQGLKSKQQKDQILKCAHPEHEEVIQVVVLDPNLIKNQRLLCKTCLENFETNHKTIGLKKVMGMTEENYIKKKQYREIIFDLNFKQLEELKQNFIKLKSYINKNLDEMIENTEIWMKDLTNYKLQDFNFHNEIDWIIQYNQKIEIEQLAQEVNPINYNQIKKLNNKLEQFSSFNEYSNCKNILNNLQPKKIQQQKQTVILEVAQGHQKNYEMDRFQGNQQTYK
ncbi:unnamed protein product [Paramecium pentaurelia]|uniref:Uncharacterized protein n=1 Tax=Paramecium pentaurelia TaxID=43138 RepID=A0A8S1UFJ6_9CILI|nr:unnamed protein product [Paramecium pentaurelia]